jgi:D-xylulose reductase
MKVFPMKALVLEKKSQLTLRDIELPLEVGPNDVKIALHTVGICGSDVHYYTHGGIGNYIVRQPMVLGHEASGIIVETGSAVRNLKVGDRVCMEPGVPNLTSRASKLGIYNVDPEDQVTFAEGAMIEPFAIGMQAATRARIAPGDTAAVIGCGPIGIMVALAALAGGCSKVYISDLSAPKLAIAGQYPGIVPVNVGEQSLADVILKDTGGWGVDVLFEASGSAKVYPDLFAPARPGGAVVLVGLPVEQVGFNVPAAVAKEIRIETVFRYANIYERALQLIASGKVNLKPVITGTFHFSESIQAFERAAKGLPSDVKLQILLDGERA